jgi:polyhydroxyalkanoate synthesis regulator phasin
MTEEAKDAGAGAREDGPDPATDAGGPDDARDSGGKRGARGKMGDGIRQGIGVLSAFRDALEETIQEARDRGDLSTDRAREVMKDALDKAQAAGERARDRLDFATHSDMDAVRGALEDLRARLARLEESVFGASTDDETGPEPRPEEGAKTKGTKAGEE